MVVLAAGEREEDLVALDLVPLTHKGRIAFQVENVLAAVAATWALGVPHEQVRAGLASFAGGPREVPGRFNVFSAGDATVIVDYAHNPSALVALVEALDHFPHQRRTLIFSGGNRRDTDILCMGEIAGDGFDRVILTEDHGHNDRGDGELATLLRRGLTQGRRVSETMAAPEERVAIEEALAALQPGDLVVIGVEAIEEVLAVVQDRLRLGDPSIPVFLL